MELERKLKELSSPFLIDEDVSCGGLYIVVAKHLINYRLTKTVLCAKWRCEILSHRMRWSSK